jgi:ABC-type branched-subunit amino acid transport system substrate-binding protein
VPSQHLQHGGGSAETIASRASEPPAQESLASAPGVPVPGATAATSLVGTIKIVSSLPREGDARGQTDGIVNAFRMALNEHNQRIGNASIVYVDMDDSSLFSNTIWNAPTEATNAGRALNDPDTMVYLGPYTSGAARQAIPILCQADMAIVSLTNTYPGLPWLAALACLDDGSERLG